MKVGFLALWLLDSGRGDLRRPGDWTKCCANPFARISPTRNLHFRKKKKHAFVSSKKFPCACFTGNQQMTKIPKLRCTNPMMHCESVLALSERFLAASNASNPQHSAPSRTGERLHIIKCSWTATRCFSLEHIATYLYKHTYTHAHTNHAYLGPRRFRQESRFISLRVLNGNAPLRFAQTCALGFSHKSDASQYNVHLFFAQSLFINFFRITIKTNNVGLIRLLSV